MEFGNLDIIHILSIFVQLPLIMVLLYKGKGNVSNRLMSFFFFAQILGSLNYLLWSQRDQLSLLHLQLVYIAPPFFTIWGPTFFLFIKSQTKANFKFKWSFFFHYIPFLALALYFVFVYHIHSPEIKKALLHSNSVYKFSVTSGLSVFISIQVFVYNLISIVTLERFALRNKSGKSELLKRIQWNRFMMYGYFIACIINNIGKVLYASNYLEESKDYMIMSGLVFLLYFTTILGNALLGSHFGGTSKSVNAQKHAPHEFEHLKQKLEHYLKTEKPYLEFNLSLSDLASKIEVSKRFLSNYINTYEHTTFQDYINQYRIKEAKRLIESNLDTAKTILEIVYESGFNSKSAFNMAFKKHTNTTPTKFKKLLQNS
ncbi:MAG: AraC family transcriptional regulator [Flavobacteriaceae bacterium]